MLPTASPIIVVTSKEAKREQGHQAQISNIRAARTISEIIRTTLGPRSMLKMLLDPMGGIVLSNDGNAILREIEVTHPAAKSIISLSRAVDEETGDGTTSVAILAGELMTVAEPFLEQKFHPTVIVQSYFQALEEIVNTATKLAIPVDVNNPKEIGKVISSCLETKFAHAWGDLVVNLAIRAIEVVRDGNVIDTKRYAKVEKVPGGDLLESKVLNGCMIEKDVTHPKMRRYIENPRILLLDCTLEYKKGESQTNLELTKEGDFAAVLKQEEEEVKKLCDLILAAKPDVVITEKGVSDLAQHFLMKGNVSVLRRARKSDNNRIGRAVGATIVHRPEEIQEADIGKKCGLFKIEQIGDEYWAFFDNCENPKACTILLRGASKDVLNEVERNLQDALGVGRNVVRNPFILPGGGAVEMHLSQHLSRVSQNIQGMEQWPYKAVGNALEVIPRTLAQNSGANVIRLVTELRAKHTNQENLYFGVDGNLGVITDMRTINVWEPLHVKIQIYKTAIEAAAMLLRIDDVLSGLSEKKKPHKAGPVNPPKEDDGI